LTIVAGHTIFCGCHLSRRYGDVLKWEQLTEPKGFTPGTIFNERVPWPNAGALKTNYG
jgi:hypothetical protein